MAITDEERKKMKNQCFDELEAVRRKLEIKHSDERCAREAELHNEMMMELNSCDKLSDINYTAYKCELQRRIAAELEKLKKSQIDERDRAEQVVIDKYLPVLELPKKEPVAVKPKKLSAFGTV